MTSAVLGATSCVVVAYHRPIPLAALVASLTPSGVEVIVVNVESDQDVAAIARHHGATEIELEGNPGFAAGVNAGVAAATRPVVVFMNDDLEVEPLAVERLAALIHSGRCDVVAPAIRTAAGAWEPSVLAIPTPGRLLLEWAMLPDRPPAWLGTGRLAATARRSVHKWTQPIWLERVPAVTAAMIACRRDLIRRLPMPEAYFLYWEELEWFSLLAAEATTVWLEPGSTVTHLGGRHDLRPEKARLLARNAVRCVRRTRGRRSGAAAWVIVLLWQSRLVSVAAVRAAFGLKGGRRELSVRSAGLAAAFAAVLELR